jgi:hypothetical protein
MRFARSDRIMRLRVATGADAMAVATLHAESWRAHYRGAYRDEYLDGEVVQDRIRVWKERLSTETLLGVSRQRVSAEGNPPEVKWPAAGRVDVNGTAGRI